MTTPSGAFQRALSRFKIALTPAEENDFRFSSLQDVYDAISKIQQEQAAKKELANLNRIGPFLEGIEQYGKIVEVFLNTSNILAFIWIASNMKEAFDKLLEAYEMLGECIPQFQQYEQIFNQPYMDSILELFYGDILEFHRRALKVFNRRGWRLIFKSAWRDFGTSFQNILDNLQRHKRLVETQASLADFEAAQKARTEVQKNFDTLHEAEKKRQRIAVTQWLAPADSSSDQEKFTSIRNLYPGTGHWLPKDRVFKAWYDPLSTAGLILWLYGIPGAGKTILSSLIVEETRKLPSTSVCFFYCKYGDQSKNTFSSVARGILVQLLHQNEDLLPFIYDKHVESWEPTLKSDRVLEELLRTALENTSKTYVVIDGLDECEKSERTKILGWFIPTIKSMAPGGMRGVFISRDEYDINKKLSKARKRRIDTKDTSNDMEVYLQTLSKEVQQKFRLSDSRRSEIVSTVFTRAEGMFLFSYLVMDNLLNQTTEEELDNELQPGVFPAGLGEAYSRVVRRIFDNPIEPQKIQAKKILGWIVSSKRPLKWYEIQGAVSINLHDRTIDPRRRLKVTMKELCGSLVEVMEDDTIELVHTTARFHLIDLKLIDAGVEDINLAALCVQYLTFGCFDKSLSDDQVRDFVLSGYYSFQDYAAAYWISHVETCGQEIANRGSGNFGLLVDYTRQLLDRHWAGAKVGLKTPSAIQKRLQAFKEFDIFEQLVLVAQPKDNDASNESANHGGIVLSIQIQRTRSALEQLLPMELTDRETLRSFYGLNWFKCDRTRCQFFHKGFISIQERESHDKEHRRIFLCTYAGCHLADLGLPSKQKLREHLTKFHLDSSPVTSYMEPQHIVQDVTIQFPEEPSVGRESPPSEFEHLQYLPASRIRSDDPDSNPSAPTSPWIDSFDFDSFLSPAD